MFKKFRKYLVVLMAVVMVASLAAIPTSAVVVGNWWTSVEGNVLYYRHVVAWSSATVPQGHFCYAEVTNYLGVVTQRDMATSTAADYISTYVDGPDYTLETYAWQCSGYGEYGTF